MDGRILLVDGNSILNRAFYGIGGGKVLTNRQGFATNAIHGFMTILLKYMADGNDYNHVAVAFDLKAPTFRHQKYDQYKAGRKPMPPELAMQFPKMKEILKAWGVSCVELPGYEADDIIGTLSRMGEEAGFGVTILTGDRDSYQLVSDKTHISLPSTKAGKTTYDLVTPDSLMEKFGLTPNQMIDLKSLMGDSSDNIPGVKGVGEKTALALVQEYGSLENILAHIGDISKPALKTKLEEGQESARLSYWLGTICREVPGVPTIEDISLKPMDRGAMYAHMEELELNKLMKALGLSPQDAVSTGEEVVARELRTYGEKKVSLGDVSAMANDLAKAETVYVYADVSGTGIDRQLNGIAICDGKTIFDMDCDVLMADNDVWKTIFAGRDRLVTNDTKGLLICLMRRGVYFEGELFDTELAAYMCDSNRRHPYVETCLEYLGVVPEENAEEQQFTLFDAMEAPKNSICVDRIKLMPDLEQVLTDAMEEAGVYNLFLMAEMPLARILAEMEMCGMDVDPEALAQLGRDYDAQITELENAIYALAGEKFNINSPSQLGQMLFVTLGLKHGRKTKTGYSTDAEVLEKLVDEHPIIPLIIKYRQISKLNSTYARGLYKFINPETGRIHTTFNQTVTATGRLSSQDPNLQNIPIRTAEGREIRKVFVCKPGEMLVSADYSQIELRVLAHVAQDVNMQEIFRQGGDIHTDTAAMVFSVPREEVTKDMRRAAKAVNLGIVYGISEFGLAKDLGIGYGEAKAYIEAYLQNFVGVRDYMAGITQEAVDKGYVTTFMGRRRYIPELKSKDHNIRSFGERVALNAPIQGAAADIIKIAMIKVEEALKASGLDADLVLQVHDELIIRCREVDYPMVVNILRENMENAVALSVPLVVDIDSGHSWFEV
ncbi:MAG: DNA polymerase I [Clostridia bacterium]|nr:DNA polymerase I [Clostridia bacterium]